MTHRLRLLLVLNCMLLFQYAHSQQFTGYHTSNYAGLYRATFNPSAIAGTRYRYQINLVSFNSTINNRYFKFFRSDALFHPFRNAYTENDMYGKSKLTGSFTQGTNVNVPSELRLPSGFVGFGKNNWLVVGFGMRMRGFVQGNGVAPIVSEVYTKRLDFGDMKASSGSFRDMVINQNSFFETALSFAAMPLRLDPIMRVKVGVTLKRLSGARNVFLHIRNANYQIRPINAEEALWDLTNVSYQYGATQPVQAFGLGSLFSSSYGSGSAIDAGVTVELGRIRQHAEYRANYILRLGAAITDAGNIVYPRNAKMYSGTINKLTLNQEQIIAMGNNAAKNLETLFPKTNPQEYSYETQLPRTINVDADVQFAKSFFINASISTPTNTGQLPTYLYQPKTTTVTPRFEGEDVEFSLPVSWLEGNDSPQVGFFVRFGPGFIGFQNFSGLTNIHKPRATLFYLGFQLWKLNDVKENKRK